MKTFIMLLVALSLPSRAATVTSTADNGPGSLREAIANAAAGETISFSVSGVITLTSGELLITNDLRIRGPGASELMIQRSTETNTPGFRIFNVRSGIATISGLTISNGREREGGGIRNETTLSLRDCVISSNRTGGSGGGIYNVGWGTLAISNSVIKGNFASGGSGIFNWGTMSITNSVISGNFAEHGYG